MRKDRVGSWFRLGMAGPALLSVLAVAQLSDAAPREAPPPQIADHLSNIAAHATPPPTATIAAGWFLMGTNRKDDDPFGFETQYDNTELPQRGVWLDGYEIDRYEVSLGEYLAHVHRLGREAPDELQRLIWHLISVHFIPDEVLAPWPAIYVAWTEAVEFCRSQGKRLPTEAEWEKAARGEHGRLFPWGKGEPTDQIAVFGRYHVHEIPLVASVDSYPEGGSPYGLHHMGGNVAEWVEDWLGFDYYSIMPRRNPAGPKEGRYKAVRGGSWKSKPHMLRTATRGGAFPDQRAPTIGFRCARSRP